MVAADQAVLKIILEDQGTKPSSQSPPPPAPSSAIPTATGKAEGGGVPSLPEKPYELQPKDILRPSYDLKPDPAPPEREKEPTPLTNDSRPQKKTDTLPPLPSQPATTNGNEKKKENENADSVEGAHTRLSPFYLPIRSVRHGAMEALKDSVTPNIATQAISRGVGTAVGTVTRSGVLAGASQAVAGGALTGGAAALTGPIGLAIGAVALASLGAKEALSSLADTVKSLDHDFTSLAAVAANFNTEASQAEADSRFRTLDAEIKRANKLGPDLATYVDKRTDLSVTMMELKADIAHLLLPAVTKIVEFVGRIAESVNLALDLFTESRDSIYKSLESLVDFTLAVAPIIPGGSIFSTFVWVLRKLEKWLPDVGANQQDFGTLKQLMQFLNPDKMSKFLQKTSPDLFNAPAPPAFSGVFPHA